MSAIVLVPIVPVDGGLIGSLISPLQSAFRIPVHLHKTDYVDPTFAFDPIRNQYNSTALIAVMLDRFPDAEGKILGITSIDLFVPVLTYVIGEAQLDGKVAVVSTYRLDDTLYGLPPNRRLTEERLFKEALHELGHTFGLIHCIDYTCVMHSSTSVEEIDVKGADFCLQCEKAIADLR